MQNGILLSPRERESETARAYGALLTNLEIHIGSRLRGAGSNDYRHVASRQAGDFDVDLIQTRTDEAPANCGVTGVLPNRTST